MFVFWFFVIIINPKSLNIKLNFACKYDNINSISEVFAIQSNKVYLAKIFNDKNNIDKFTTIQFKNNQGRLLKGFIFDIYELNNQRWAKICVLQNL